MTDEKIKAEFEKNANVDADYKCLQFALNYSGDGQLKVISAGSFYAGFRAAERIAKIGVLEKLLINMESLSTQSAITTIDNMLSELKAGR